MLNQQAVVFWQVIDKVIDIDDKVAQPDYKFEGGGGGGEVKMYHYVYIKLYI
jgi:hypothetical protein